jgi:hypothetical protein
METDEDVISVLSEVMNRDLDPDRPNTKFVNYLRFLLDDGDRLTRYRSADSRIAPLLYVQGSGDLLAGVRQTNCYLLVDGRAPSVRTFHVVVYTIVTRFASSVRREVRRKSVGDGFLQMAQGDLDVAETEDDESVSYVRAELQGLSYRFSFVDSSDVGDVERCLTLPRRLRQ